MRNLIALIRQTISNIFVNKTKNPLGRWNIETCNKRLNNKIDLANEDHCGPCGKYIYEKTVNIDKKHKPLI